jgi:hypothetical protein
MGHEEDDERRLPQDKKKSKKKTLSLNDEIETIKPYNFRHFLLHLNILPFFLAYFVWLAVWTNHFGVEEFPELGIYFIKKKKRFGSESIKLF